MTTARGKSVYRRSTKSVSPAAPPPTSASRPAASLYSLMAYTSSRASSDDEADRGSTDIIATLPLTNVDAYAAA